MMESRALTMSVCFTLLASAYGLFLYFGESKVASVVLMSAFFRLCRPVTARFIILLVPFHEEAGYWRAAPLSSPKSDSGGDPMSVSRGDPSV